ncbi:MAG TPA: MOSC domain-containing protein [Gemmatimonadales bacterium]|jgi:MOSC domain-containing protein YiiM|nr:MOSC domain-containing protein [Gemmatimonadales bacterium]
MNGSVSRLGIKPLVPGEVGLPKHAVPLLKVGVNGAEGDYNHYRATELHGDADQALLLVTEDLLAQLNAAGWPVQPGDLGENLTLRGVPEVNLQPGVRLAIGAIGIEVTRPCGPCKNLYALPYVGRERGPAFLKATVGRRGWYARVLNEGELRTGAGVEIRPPAAG